MCGGHVGRSSVDRGPISVCFRYRRSAAMASRVVLLIAGTGECYWVQLIGLRISSRVTVLWEQLWWDPAW